MIYLYSDESTFSKPNNYVGTGVLSSESPIDKNVISDAIKALKKDEDRLKEPEKKLDKKTLSRGYFHASEDSKNAHSHLCTSINKHIDAEFNCIFLNPKVDRETSKNELYRLTSIFSNDWALKTRENVLLTIEDRGGLTISKLKEWNNQRENHMLLDSYEFPFFPIYFPKVEFNIKNSTDPGLQCTDFVLWCVNRETNGDSTWIKRINTQYRDKIQTENNSSGGSNISINKGIELTNPFYTIKDFPEKKGESPNHDLLGSYYVWAINIIENIVKDKFPSHISHLEEGCISLIKNKNNINYPGYIEELATVYLKLFDTTPLIDNNTNQEVKEKLLLSKKYLSLVLNKQFMHAMTTLMFFNKLRRDIINKTVNIIKK